MQTCANFLMTPIFFRKMVRIAGLEPAHLSALPPQSSVSANSTICAHRGDLSCPMRSRTQAISAAQYPVPAVPASGLPGVEIATARLPQVKLHQDGDAVGTAAIGTEGVNAIGVGDDALEPVGGRAIHDSRANAAHPVAGLFSAGKIIHRGGGAVEFQIPALVGRDGQHIAGVDQRELAGAEFLEKIAGQRQRIFRDERQKSAQPIRAEAVGVQAGAGDEPRKEILFAFGQRVGERRRGPEQVRRRFQFAVVIKAILAGAGAELAVWYEGQFRTSPGEYGFNDDRELEPASHLFWASASLSYTLPESKQTFFARLITGTSLNADRFSAYRLGGFLPLIAEYPLSLPGYFFQEFSARQFALVNASYVLPIAPNQRWNLEFNGATATMDYLSGTEQPGNWVSGVGAGIMYRSPADRFKCIVAYAYGIDAFRSNGRGAHSVTILMQFDLGKSRGGDFNTGQPGRWNGWNWILGR